MPKIGEISVENQTTHADDHDLFLYHHPEDVTAATDVFRRAGISEIPINITNKLNSTPGLDASAFNVDGYAPLNAIAVKFAGDTEEQFKYFAELQTLIENETNSHIYQEGATNYIVVFTKYQELCKEVLGALNTYNNNRFVQKHEITIEDKTLTCVDYYPQCAFSCSNDKEPSLELSYPVIDAEKYEYINPAGTANYQALVAAFEKAEAFYDKYCPDATIFLENTSGFAVKGEDYDFETDLNNLKNNWMETPENENPAEETPTEETPTEENPVEEPLPEETNPVQQATQKEEPSSEEVIETPEGESTKEETVETAAKTLNRYDRVEIDGDLATTLDIYGEGHELHYYGSLVDSAGNEVPIYYDSGEHNETYTGTLMWTEDAARLFTIVNGEKCYITNNPETQAYNDTRGGNGYGASSSVLHYDVSILTNKDGTPAETYNVMNGTASTENTVFYNQDTALAKDGIYYYKDQEGNTITLDATGGWSNSSNVQDIGNYTSDGVGGEEIWG